MNPVTKRMRELKKYYGWRSIGKTLFHSDKKSGNQDMNDCFFETKFMLIKQGKLKVKR